MGKSQVPRGSTKKRRCKKCGSLFYPQIYGSAAKITEECSICNPKIYNKEKKK